MLAGSDFVRTATAPTDSDSPPRRQTPKMLTKRVLNCAGGIGKARRSGEDYGRWEWERGRGKAALAIYPSIFHFRRGRRSRKREGRHHAPTRCSGTQTYRFNMNLLLDPSFGLNITHRRCNRHYQPTFITRQPVGVWVVPRLIHRCLDVGGGTQLTKNVEGAFYSGQFD